MSKTRTSRMALFSILAFFLAVGFFTGCGKDEVDISTPFQDKVVLKKGVEIDMIQVNPGLYTVGLPHEDKLWRADTERREVSVSVPYWLGKYEVTQEQWEAVMSGEKRADGTDLTNPSKYQGKKKPVENIRREDVEVFLRKVNDLYAGRLPEGYRLDLPTPEQWEIACRAGTTTDMPWGTREKTEEKANLDCLEEVISSTGFMSGLVHGYSHHIKRTWNRTREVGSYPPNAWGFCDMIGNVAELCRDKTFWTGKLASRNEDAEYKTERVLVHGGSWAERVEVVSPANSGWVRHYDPGDNESVSTIGFRLALAPFETNSSSAIMQERQTGADDSKIELARGENDKIVITLPNGIKMNLIRIKPGAFLCGRLSPLYDDGHASMGRVKGELSREYWIGETEVTQEQYEAVMGKDSAGNCLFSKHPKVPVVYVSYDDALAFCGRLNDLTTRPNGFSFTLPTNVQWEYACRAGTTTHFNNGKDQYRVKTDKVTEFLYEAAYDCPPYDPYLAEIAWHYQLDAPRPVALKKPNAWGLYDMHGNVREFCLDYHKMDSAESDYFVDPFFELGYVIRAGKATHEKKVERRGGSFCSNAVECAAGYWNLGIGETQTEPDTGFRIVLSTEQKFVKGSVDWEEKFSKQQDE